ncbi:MAG: SAM-dependent methyltransferase [Brachymonas sp.]|jgi:SAM-dependent MidA family methyltransferase|nr:SAM-dependent methyltransferase [Brachymonas sp.]MBP6967206.1 SAM-dependent methyltransferase [Brachymonas sp.]MBP7724815.1 SAM-dependent methyltransferase [Brachymonas sp.]MBP7733823.1 SAM-dependent methyltransferase [Brachymonas sp.]MBP7744256.1 SAM-dependent methyltransferase [Brachymonas sp.]
MPTHHHYTNQHALAAHIRQAIIQAGGWLAFDQFMQLALYTPHLGYYAHGSAKLGHLPRDGSDFVTAPEISPLFGQTLAAQVQQALHHTQTDTIWEFGAGSGALAEQILDTLATQGTAPRQYAIVDISGSLRQRQQQRLARFGDLVQWHTQLPPAMQGVIIGNEVLDAMPVKLLVRTHNIWHERGVTVADLPSAPTAPTAPTAPAAPTAPPAAPHTSAPSTPHASSPANTPASHHFAFSWHDQPTTLRPPYEVSGTHHYLTEIHPQAHAFIRTLGERLQRGAAFFIDYGFGEGEYYHPQRHMGTLMCHQAHRADPDPLHAVGDKDITAHINFTDIAVAAQNAGLDLLGYTTQGWFLLNCGIASHMQQAPLPQRALAQRLLLEHEMGELFKVIGLCKGAPWSACGFTQGSRLRSL